MFVVNEKITSNENENLRKRCILSCELGRFLMLTLPVRLVVIPVNAIFKNNNEMRHHLGELRNSELKCMVLKKSGKVQDRTVGADFKTFLPALCQRRGSTSC